MGLLKNSEDLITSEILWCFLVLIADFSTILGCFAV